MNIENSKLARSLFSKTSKLEQDLAQLLKKKSPVDRSITQLRDQIRDNYEQVLLADLVFAQSKDIDQLLWKCVFYKAIEEFRKIIQKYQKASTSTSGKDQETAKEKLSKITTAFLTFLGDASKYYESLFDRLTSKYEECKAANQQDLCAIYFPILQKMYITLGDLARYAQLHSESQSKDWSNAVSYYVKALNFNPANGNSHNQLAVISTYKNDDFEGCYRYFRSLAVKKPFLSARENLILLFERNRQRHVKLTQKAVNDSKQNNSNGRSSHHRNSKKKLTMFKEVSRSNEEIFERILVEFVRLHGIIFTRINVETFDDIKGSTFSDLRHLLSNNYNSSKTTTLLTDDYLLKMTLMNIFSLDHGLQQQDPIVLQNAISLAFDMHVALCEAVTKSNQQQVSTSAIVSSLNILLQFIKLQAQALAPFGLDNIWTNTAAVVNKLISQSMDISVNKDETIEHNCMTQFLLPEDIELRGFKPLNLSGDESQQATEVAPKDLLHSIRVNRFIKTVKAVSQSPNAGIKLDLQRAAFYTVPSVSSSAQFISSHIPLEEGDDEAFNEDEEADYNNSNDNQYEFNEQPENGKHNYAANHATNHANEFLKGGLPVEEELGASDSEQNDDGDDGEVFMFDNSTSSNNNKANAWHLPAMDNGNNHANPTSSLFSNSFFAAPSAFGAFNSPWSAPASNTNTSSTPNSKIIERPRSDSNPIAPQNAFTSWASPQPQPNFANNGMSPSFGSFGMFNEDAKWSGSPQPKNNMNNPTPIGKRAFIS